MASKIPPNLLKNIPQLKHSQSQPKNKIRSSTQANNPISTNQKHQSNHVNTNSTPNINANNNNLAYSNNHHDHTIPNLEDFDLLAGHDFGHTQEFTHFADEADEEKVLVWQKLETNGFQPAAREVRVALLS
jgi:hypothetical protein